MNSPERISFNNVQLFYEKHENIDWGNSYFMGICTTLFTSIQSLSIFESTLSWNLSSKATRLERWEINFLANFIYRLSKSDSGSIDNASYVLHLKKFAEKIEYWFKDFGAIKTLFLPFTSIQWFFIGSFMAGRNSVDLPILLSTVEIEFISQRNKFDEQNKGKFLISLLESKSEVLKKSKREKLKEDISSSENLVKEEAICPICLETAEETCLTSLFLCQHSFHLECLQQYLNIKIEERSFPMICPMEKCSLQIFGSEVSKLLDEEYKNKYFIYSFDYYIDTHPDEFFRCPGGYCDSFASRKDAESFNCSTCEKTYCLKCCMEMHGGMTCKEYEITIRGDSIFKKWKNKNACQKCSVCHSIVLKNGGCNHVICRCQHQFCYDCGATWKTCDCARF